MFSKNIILNLIENIRRGVRHDASCPEGWFCNGCNQEDQIDRLEKMLEPVVGLVDTIERLKEGKR